MERIQLPAGKTTSKTYESERFALRLERKTEKLRLHAIEEVLSLKMKSNAAPNQGANRVA